MLDLQCLNADATISVQQVHLQQFRTVSLNLLDMCCAGAMKSKDSAPVTRM